VVDGEGTDGRQDGRRHRRSGRRHRHRAQRPFWQELPLLLVVAVVIALLVKTFLAQAFYIPSASMETTLHGCTGCSGDRILVTKPQYWFGDPQPGDVVVFRGPSSWQPEVATAEPGNWVSRSLLSVARALGAAPPSGRDFVKRVIAVGGQTVQCCDDQARVTVDGRPLDEPYLHGADRTDDLGFGPVTVPAGRLWVMGDHRSDSADSRVHIDDQWQGTVAVDEVIGKAEVIVWPVGRIGVVGSPDIQRGATALGLPDPSAPLLTGAAVLVRRRRQ
jgi:signal peptidase I